MDEKNNCAELILTVKGKEITGDLVVEKITITPSSPSEGERVSFAARVKNIGNTLAPTSHTYFTLDNGYLGRIRTASIGSSLYEDIGTAWLAAPGSHSYEICADGKKEVLEENEENNCIKGTLSTKVAEENN